MIWVWRRRVGAWEIWGEESWGFRVGLLSLLGTSHWCTCPVIQCSIGSHPEPLVPAPQQEQFLWPGTSESMGCRGHWRQEAIHKTVPGTWRHCEQSTAGHENHLLLVDSPEEKKEEKISTSVLGQPVAMNYRCLNHSPVVLLLNLFPLVHICGEVCVHSQSFPDKFSSAIEEKEKRITLFNCLFIWALLTSFFFSFFASSVGRVIRTRKCDTCLHFFNLSFHNLNN